MKLSGELHPGSQLSYLFQVIDLCSVACYSGIKKLAPIKTIFPSLQRKEFMTAIVSFGFQKQPKAAPKTKRNTSAIYPKKGTARHKMITRNFFCASGTLAFQARCLTNFHSREKCIVLHKVDAAFMLRSYKRLKTVSSSL